MDENKVRNVLVSMLNDIAEQARTDALAGQSNIGSIYDHAAPTLRKLDEKQIKQAIQDINKATATKEGTARLVNALLVAARTVAAITIRPV